MRVQILFLVGLIGASVANAAENKNQKNDLKSIQGLIARTEGEGYFWIYNKGAYQFSEFNNSNITNGTMADLKEGTIVRVLYKEATVSEEDAFLMVKPKSILIVKKTSIRLSIENKMATGVIWAPPTNEFPRMHVSINGESHEFSIAKSKIFGGDKSSLVTGATVRIICEGPVVNEKVPYYVPEAANITILQKPSGS